MPIDPNCVISFIPSSKLKSESDYDPRFEMLLEDLARLRPDLNFDNPLERVLSVEAAHKSDERPSIDQIAETLKYVGFKATPTRVAFIDDVITAGSHFMACRRLVLQNEPHLKVHGVFWAKTVWVTRETVAPEKKP